MKQMRRAAIYKLAASAHEMELDVMNGILRRDDDGRWHIGDYDLLAWLDAHHGEEMVVVLGSMADEREAVSYTHLRAHETVLDLVCRLLLEKKNQDPL